MLKISNEELSKITQFIAGCNDMINGKFILADLKISKLLHMLAQSEELYNYVKECMVDFDFSREFHRAEIKNRLNNGSFVAPQSNNSLVAFIFCLLVECDAKRIDFYNFINENFPSENKSDCYKKFAKTLLVPFKDIVAEHFSLETPAKQNLEFETDLYKQDLQAEPVFEESYDSEFAQSVDGESEDLDDENSQQSDDTIWEDIKSICDNTISAVYSEKKIKDYLKEELIYILKTIKYSTKYMDAKIISALVTAFDELSKKYKSVQFVFGELKNRLEDLYQI